MSFLYERIDKGGLTMNIKYIGLSDAEKFAKNEFDKYYKKNGIQLSHKVSYAASINDRTIGVVIANIFESEAYINSLVVAEEYRGLGIGAELLQRVEEYCKKQWGKAYSTKYISF